MFMFDEERYREAIYDALNKPSEAREANEFDTDDVCRIFKKYLDRDPKVYCELKHNFSIKDEDNTEIHIDANFISFNRCLNNALYDYSKQKEDKDYRLKERIAKNLDNYLCIEKVIYNGPATIIFWKDGDKTIVKCKEGETLDPEKGFLAAIAKRVYGKPQLKRLCNKYIPNEEE